MKLNKREKILSIILCVLIVSYLAYQFIIKPQINEMNELKEEQAKYAALKDSINSNISQSNPIYEQYKELNFEINTITAPFYPEIIQEKFITMLDKKILDAGIVGNSMSFEPTIIVELRSKDKTQKYKLREFYLNDLAQSITNKEIDIKKDNKSDEESDSKSEEISKIQALKMRCTLSVAGEYKDIVKFIESIEEIGRYVMIDDVTLANLEGKIGGSIIVDFYSIPKLSNETDTEFLDWELPYEKGTKNPFGGSAVFLPSNNKRQKADFFMSLKSNNADLPSIAIGKSEDTTRDTYLYADGNEFKDIEITVTKKDGKYYFKYKSDKGAYPKKGEEEFSPNASRLMIDVYSTPRVDDKDKSGVNLKVINETDKQFIVNVINDDMSKTRIKVSKGKKNTVINR